MNNARTNLLDTAGDFTWCWSDKFFIETANGNYIWSDPDYHGDNTITKTKETLREFCASLNISYGKDKGRHTIREYCGADVVVKL